LIAGVLAAPGHESTYGLHLPRIEANKNTVTKYKAKVGPTQRTFFDWTPRRGIK